MLSRGKKLATPLAWTPTESLTAKRLIAKELQVSQGRNHRSGPHLISVRLAEFDAPLLEKHVFRTEMPLRRNSEAAAQIQTGGILAPQLQVDP
jgi:hypothetical protein